jgi:MoxR-like ATPase
MKESLLELTIPETAKLAKAVLAEVGHAIVGKQAVLEQVLAAFLAGGHVLMEDYPGLAKTLIANSFAVALGLDFKRIQFTPDLLPGDITGSYVYDRGGNQFVLRKGPIFSNIVLADEINRASPRTQSALLEAMQEGQATIEGETLPLPQPFMVIATQNPIEYEGTFPLPEAQLDRFIVRLRVGYPNPSEEQEILRRRIERRHDHFDLNAATDAAGFLAMQRAIETVRIDADLQNYIVQLVTRTRGHRQTAVGASPRGSLALLKLGRAWAAIQGRSYVLPDDLKHFARPALAHRLILQPDLWSAPQAADRVVDEIVQSVPVPVIGEDER